MQQHGFEVDLIGARADRLVLATVKSFFGSAGVKAPEVTGTAPADQTKGYALLNNPSVRDAVLAEAGNRYGYESQQIELRLYAGKFAAPKLHTHEPVIRAWAAEQVVSAGPIKVVGLADVVARVQEAASHKQYRDNPVLVTMKVLEAAGKLNLTLPDDIGSD